MLKKLKDNLGITISVILSFILFSILSNNGKYYVDDPNYLYANGFLSIDKLTNLSFYNYKLGNIYLLNTLVNFFGIGENSFNLIHLIYFGFLILFILISYVFLRKISDNQFSPVLLITFFCMPLMAFLSFKVLSEITSILWGILGILFCYIGLYEKKKKNYYIYLFVSGLFVSLAVLFRFDGLIFFLSFLLAYSLIYYKTFKFSKTIIIFASFFIFISVFYVFLKYNPITYFVQTGENEIDFELLQYIKSILKIFLIAGFMNIFIFFSLRTRKTNLYKFLIIWLILSILPLLIFYDLPFLTYTLIPYTALIYIGIENLLSSFNLKGIFSLPIFLSLILLSNFFIVPIFVVNLDGRVYSDIIQELEVENISPIILTSNTWVDYSYLKFFYPDKQIYSVMSIRISGWEEEKYNTLYSNSYILESNNLKKFSNSSIFYIIYEHTTVIGEKTSTFNNSWLPSDPNLKLLKYSEKSRGYDKYIVYYVKFI